MKTETNTPKNTTNKTPENTTNKTPKKIETNTENTIIAIMNALQARKENNEDKKSISEDAATFGGNNTAKHHFS